jgi:hypothetical protein
MAVTKKSLATSDAPKSTKTTKAAPTAPAPATKLVAARLRSARSVD